MIIEICFDLALLLGWVLVLMASVYFIKVSGVTKNWGIPLTVIGLVLAFVIAVVWGFFVEGFALGSVFKYGIPNGLALGLCASVIYDAIHGFVKCKATYVALAGKVKALFKKKEAKA